MAELDAILAPLRMDRAAETVAMAEAWTAEHPEAYAYIERRFLEEARAERPVSMRALLEEVRGKALDSGSSGVKVNNLISPVLARKMREAHPSEARFLTFRHAMVDELEG